ncbi:outer membrane protein [Jeongeupia chitinilytica]|uniref:Outer membrane protein n=2 Tax=Jeongeupia chitinilytica TaxID=1041641 RepID=A0ABQ3H297_9NEIS|nr:outer membrane protein [Jeongeupia chitinilytica]
MAAALLGVAPLAGATDLMDAWRAARGYDAAFAASRSALTAGREKTNQGNALLLPQVTLSGNAGVASTDYQAGQATLLNPNYDMHGNQYGLKVTAAQPIYRADAFVGSDQLKKQADQAEVQFRSAEQDLILRVAKAYFEVIAAEEAVRFSAAQKAAVAQQLAQAKKSFEVGTATITDTHEAQARYDSIIATEINAQNDLEVKRNAFTQLTNQDPTVLAKISTQLEPSPPQPNSMADWLVRADTGSLAIAGQKLGLDIATRQIDRYRVSTAPTLDLVASYGSDWAGDGLARGGTGTDRTSNGLIGLQLSIPLFTGGNRSSQFREAIALEEQQRQTLEATRRDAAQSTKQAFLGVQNGAAQVRALEQAEVSAKSSLESTKLGRDVGVRTTVDVLNAEQNYYQTRFNLVVTRYQYLFARLQLAAAVGALDEAQLQDINRWLDSNPVLRNGLSGTQ